MGEQDEVSYSVHHLHSTHSSLTLTISPNGLFHKPRSGQCNNQMDGGDTKKYYISSIGSLLPVRGMSCPELLWPMAEAKCL